MVCASVQEDNPRVLGSGLSPVQTQSYTITCFLHQHAVSPSIAKYFDVEEKVQKHIFSMGIMSTICKWK